MDAVFGAADDALRRLEVLRILFKVLPSLSVAELERAHSVLAPPAHRRPRAAAPVETRSAKPRLELVPSSAIVAAGRAITFGASKYPERGYKRRRRPDEHVGAVLRHLLAWNGGEERDPESGLSHLDHAIARLAMLVDLDQRAGQRRQRRRR